MVNGGSLNKKLVALAVAVVVSLGFVTASVRADLVSIASVTGSNGGDRYANGMTSLTDGSGIAKADASDPSTWTFDGSHYSDEWMAWYFKDGDGNPTTGLNGKLAWASLDFGTTSALQDLYIFNNNYAGGVSGMQDFNLYYADSPSVALPATPAKNTFADTGLTPEGDYDFSSGGWTLFNTSGNLTATQADVTVLDLSGVSARYLGIEILSNYGDTYNGGRVGFDEVAVTEGVIPEPSAAILAVLGALGLMLRGRRK